ncbi:bolA-like protein DDB_G0274169 isoform X2 [Linepithema humile]|uniref:bolA-like protein DDB_G0274169 isoform X2 n=1 Tax=Linepithema humile TaxID=83485 RepID=UPI00351E8868
MYKARQLRKLIIRADSIFCWQNMSSGETLSRPVESLIRKKLEAGLKPLYCDIINESYMHNVPKGSETHFKVVIVSDKFDKQPLIKAKTPEQWEVSDKTISASPACRGGFGK